MTEQSTWDRMNGQTNVLKEAFEAEHPGVTVRVDCLPTKAQEREVRLQQLRTEILRGDGPDAYLLPTGSTLVLDEPTQYTYMEIEPLFPDVELAMRSGLFLDISERYDADDALGKEGLNAEIMDAGVVDGARYVLPLRYDMPVIYALDDALEEAGLDPSVLTKDICAVMEAVLETGDPVLAGGVLFEELSVFSDVIDYRTGNVLLEAEQAGRFMDAYQKLKALLGTEYYDYDRNSAESRMQLPAEEDTVTLENLDIRKYIYGGYDGADAGSAYYPLWIGSMQDAFDYVPLSVFRECALTILPLRSAGTGDVVATVSYYAAVGSGCDDPALAYEFLRQFLLEDSQWERNRPVREHYRPPRAAAGNTSNDLQYPGLIEAGWPVRDRGTVQTMWNVRRKQLYVRDIDPGFQRRRMRMIGLMSMEEDSIPLFDVPIGQVRFSGTASEAFAELLSQLNDTENGNAPVPADTARLAEQLIWDLRLHAAEG